MYTRDYARWYADQSVVNTGSNVDGGEGRVVIGQM